MKNTGFEEFDHTADIGIKVYGEDLKALFINAARGMFTVMRSDDGDGLLGAERNSTHSERIEIASTDQATLIHDWMSELLFLHTTKKKYFTEFKIDELDETHLKAVAKGFTISDEDEHLLMDIKAVTYHGLEIKKISDGYTAQIIFDI